LLKGKKMDHLILWKKKKKSSFPLTKRAVFPKKKTNTPGRDINTPHARERRGYHREILLRRPEKGGENHADPIEKKPRAVLRGGCPTKRN